MNIETKRVDRFFSIFLTHKSNTTHNRFFFEIDHKNKSKRKSRAIEEEVIKKLLIPPYSISILVLHFSIFFLHFGGENNEKLCDEHFPL
jgi:type III secretory pathway component EscR